MQEFIRSEMLLGKTSIKTLSSSSVLIFGVGGVGSYVCEALARIGVGHFLLVDNDIISVSNINRQIIALHSTVGMHKTDVMKQRILDINPSANVETKKIFYNSENSDFIDFKSFDYIIDAIDTVTSKLLIIEKAKKLNIPIISSMGTGNKLDPSKFIISDISKTNTCPLAKVIRKELKIRYIKNLKVLWSSEKPISPLFHDENDLQQRRSTPGSVSFVPSVAGLMIAGEVVKDLIKTYEKEGENQ